MEQLYKLEKWSWSPGDFEPWSWHDCTIHAMAIDTDAQQLFFDVDFIFRWVHGEDAAAHFHRFWVAPCTLRFNEAYAPRIDVDCYAGSLQLNQVERRDSPEPANNGWLWILECHQGAIQFIAEGYDLIVRRTPLLISSQGFSIVERGGYSFSTQTGAEN